MCGENAWPAVCNVSLTNGCVRKLEFDQSKKSICNSRDSKGLAGCLLHTTSFEMINATLFKEEKKEKKLKAKRRK